MKIIKCANTRFLSGQKPDKNCGLYNKCLSIHAFKVVITVYCLQIDSLTFLLIALSEFCMFLANSNSKHMSSESSDEGEANDEDGYESLDLERPKKGFQCKHTSVAQSCTHSGHAQP